MKNMSGPWKCPCGAEKKIHFKKPTFFQGSFLNVTCDRCGSLFTVRLKRIPGSDQLNVSNTCQEPSQILKSVLKEKSRKEYETD